MEFFGASDEIAPAPPPQAASPPPTFEVWRENWATLMLFLRLRTQWHSIATADGEVARIGLRRSAVEFELRHGSEVPKRRWRKVINQLYAMEAAALEVFNENLDKRRTIRLEELKRQRNQ